MHRWLNYEIVFFSYIFPRWWSWLSSIYLLSPRHWCYIKSEEDFAFVWNEIESWCNRMKRKKPLFSFSDVYMLIFDPQPMTSTEVIDGIRLRTISIACHFFHIDWYICRCINQMFDNVDECDEWLKAWPEWNARAREREEIIWDNEQIWAWTILIRINNHQCSNIKKVESMSTLLFYRVVQMHIFVLRLDLRYLRCQRISPLHKWPRKLHTSMYNDKLPPSSIEQKKVNHLIGELLIS